MTAPEPETTLAPLSTLMARLADELERLVVPRVAGEAWVTASEGVLLLRQIVRDRTGALDDDLPNYCRVIECQDLTAQGSALCKAHTEARRRIYALREGRAL